MFYTGLFNLDGNTVKRIHDAEIYDDDVISGFSFSDDKALFNGGYVSNIGNVITIHIKEEATTKVDDVKHWFHLIDDNIEVLVEPFYGWDE